MNRYVSPEGFDYRKRKRLRIWIQEKGIPRYLEEKEKFLEYTWHQRAWIQINWQKWEMHISHKPVLCFIALLFMCQFLLTDDEERVIALCLSVFFLISYLYFSKAIHDLLVTKSKKLEREFHDLFLNQLTMERKVLSCWRIFLDTEDLCEEFGGIYVEMYKYLVYIRIQRWKLAIHNIIKAKYNYFIERYYLKLEKVQTLLVNGVELSYQLKTINYDPENYLAGLNYPLLTTINMFLFIPLSTKEIRGPNDCTRFTTFFLISNLSRI